METVSSLLMGYGETIGWVSAGEFGMVVFCKRCGSPVKLDNARLADAGYSMKCQQCQRPVELDTVRPRARSAAPGPGAPAPSPGTIAARMPEPGAAEERTQALDRNHYLQKIRLFSGLPYEECVLIEGRMRPLEFAPQQILVEEGGPGDAMFFITSGAVEVRKKDPNSGIDFLLSELKAGSCFGEMALLKGKPRVASVVAVEPTTCFGAGAIGFRRSAADEFQSRPRHEPRACGTTGRSQPANRNTSTSTSPNFNSTRASLNFSRGRLWSSSVLCPWPSSNNRLTLAMVNPNNLAALDDVRRVIKGVIIEPATTSEDDFKRFMTSAYTRHCAQRRGKGGARERLGGPEDAAAAEDRESESAASKSDLAESILESMQSEALQVRGGR